MAKENQNRVEKKPASKLSKVTKPRVRKETKTSQMTEMVTDAFNKLARKEGITLASIRKYVAETFAVQMTKPNQTMIKKVIGKGFRDGQIVMTNDRGNSIDYTKRFDMIDDEDTDPDAEEEE